jgi:FtsP/CotA-like multicopper oxidase with cupredoxin domain
VPVAGEADRDRHQFWELFPPRALYELRVGETMRSFHPELPDSKVWGFEGSSPGPTILARYGEPIVVRFRNQLPRDHVGFGIPQVTIHLHNAHTAPASDGFPEAYYNPGLFKDHHYANALPGFSTGETDINEALGTLWYHDHRVGFTAQNVYRGLVGCYLLFDDRDSGDETDSRGFRLPSGEFDIPLVLCDRIFDAEGQLFFDLFNNDGIVGDKFIVNGAVQPFLKVARRKYRFRFINTGPSRFYQLFLSDDSGFFQISNDGNLLPAPLPVQSIRLAVAERADVIIDFSRYQIGQRIELQNRLLQVSGRGPTDQLVRPGDALLRFEVDRDAADASLVPDQLRAAPVTGEAALIRNWRFERDNGTWAINGRFFDSKRVDAFAKRGSRELWVFQNHSGDWSHPIHIHQEEFQVLSRNGGPPRDSENGRKDVIWLGPNEEIRTLRRFRDFVGRYPIHCHNVIHEDHDMMTQFEVIS